MAQRTVTPARGGHPGRRVDRPCRAVDHVRMNAPDQPGSAPQLPTELTRPHSWNELLHEMQELHARLEYLRLMLRLNQQPG